MPCIQTCRLSTPIVKNALENYGSRMFLSSSLPQKKLKSPHETEYILHEREIIGIKRYYKHCFRCTTIYLLGGNVNVHISA